MSAINCTYKKCVQQPINNLVECWNECPMLPTEEGPVAANTVIKKGQPVKKNAAGFLVPLLPDDSATDVYGIAYHDQTTGAVVTACDTTCVITNDTRVRQSQMVLTGFTSAQVAALVAALKVKRIAVNAKQ
jgi:hypothetical protein